VIQLAVVPAEAVWRRWVGGQGLVEYGLILSLTALFTVVILVVFGGALADFLDLVGDAIDAATGT
jgi:Flp pilus assembly pilin Flp